MDGDADRRRDDADRRERVARGRARSHRIGLSRRWAGGIVYGRARRDRHFVVC